MRLNFSKMHGLGNDFVMVDGIRQPALLNADIVCRIGDRRLGVGFDQLLEVVASNECESGIGVRIFNTDGTEAEHCGNGMRCFARFLSECSLLPGPNPFLVATSAGPVSLELLEGSLVKVGMGIPDFRPASIPAFFDVERPQYRVYLTGHAVDMAAVAIGNPHAVVPVEDTELAPVEALGTAIQASCWFPRGVNVGFRQIVSRDRIKLRVFERGVGETLACGSGACAAVATAIHQGLLNETVGVDLPGGALTVSWSGAGQTIWLTGPTARVFDGEIEI